jgi:high-affinity Fe2+/Pb2+ permease
MLIAILGGCLVSCADIWFKPVEQYLFDLNIVAIMCLVFSAIFTIYLFRQFNDLSVGTKNQFMMFFTSLVVAEGLLLTVVLMLPRLAASGVISLQDPTALSNLYKTLVALSAILEGFIHQPHHYAPIGKCT